MFERTRPARFVISAALLVPGCSGTALVGAGPLEGATFPGDALRVSSALPAGRRSRFRPAATVGAEAEADSPPVLQLPPLERWPRTMWIEGAAYALVQFNPYVGHLGVVAERKRADAGLGYGLVCGYRMTVRGTTVLALEAGFDASEHENEVSRTGAHATRVGLGLRASFRGDERLQPFMTAGAGRYALDFDDMSPEYDLSGLGVSFGGGVDFSPSRRFSARGELSMGLWEAADEFGGSGLAATVTFGLGAMVSF